MQHDNHRLAKRQKLFHLDRGGLSLRRSGRDGVTVRVDIANTGKMAGKEIVQLYVADQTGSAVRPVQELKAFTSLYLQPGETKTAVMELDERAFS
ncbi:MAG: fibronectin type III-like domain-contianing protein [Lachnospiraceae bacterium]|nr:fibronectin type III-like domain-contianing protein [Lachnospiraceae bacterium]